MRHRAICTECDSCGLFEKFALTVSLLHGIYRAGPTRSSQEGWGRTAEVSSVVNLSANAVLVFHIGCPPPRSSVLDGEAPKRVRGASGPELANCCFAHHPLGFPVCDDSVMRDLVVLFIHFIAALARLLGPAPRPLDMRKGSA